MRKDTMKFMRIAVLSGLMIMPLSGCWQKTVKVDQAEEIARVTDTVSAKSTDKAKAVSTGKVESAKVESVAINEGAGSAEPLETPLPGQGGMPAISGVSEGSGMSGSGEVVAGSRTDVGLIPVYFDFDKSVVRPDQIERIESNARFLKGNPEIKVRIEGNCDARGTNEYNMALGERRAMGTLKYLANLGIADSRLSSLSYGEERPLSSGNDEVAWAANRRGDFVVVR